ncbi:putative gustatory receptor 28b [Cylas formicarius]|uniref:putative gustatory receptor 28b n=1 Tax=Cylas formicarius TaxID=197179 RepID=UPI00295866A8|nr:putative gustatory receptor 28b [Cylas formicarius]
MFDKVDVEIIRAGLSIDYRQFRKIYRKLIIIAICSGFCKSLSHILVFQSLSVQCLTANLSKVINILRKYFVIVMMLHVDIRFLEINNGMKRLISKVDSGTKLALIFTEEHSQITDRLHTYCYIHRTLSQAACKLNDIFSMELLFSLALSLVSVLHFSYFLYFVSTKENGFSNNTDIYSIVFCVVSLVDEMIVVFIVISSYTNVCDTANEITSLLHELRNKISNSEFDEQVQIICIQLLHQRLKFSARGFFQIDYSLIYSMASHLVNYFIILVQYAQSVQNYLKQQQRQNNREF